MASAARRARGAARVPFAVLASPTTARNARAIALAENVAAAPEFAPFAQRVRRSGKAAPAKKCAGLLSPVSVSKKPAVTASRRRVGSLSARCATPAPAKAPRAPLGEVAEEGRAGEVGVNLLAPFDEEGHGHGGHQEQPRGGGEAAASRKRTTRGVAIEEAMAIEEVMAGIPEHGEGRVKYLVDTFERLLALAAAEGGPEARTKGSRRRTEEATPSARTSSPAPTRTPPPPPPPPPAADEIDVSYPSSEVSFPAIAGVACILDASDRTSMIGAAREQRRLRRYKSTGTSQRTCNRKVSTMTSQRPFKLRTEQRGKAKEENFVQRVRMMQLEEEMMRDPLAQGLPFTTDEPEYPVKPPVKEPTEPIDLVLHSDVRAVGRAEFDHQVAERTSFMEEVKLENERQKKMEEEIEIKQLRKEQVPKAHPMPDFSKPFVPKRSVKPHTIPKEPRFHSRLRRNTAKA